VQGQIKHWWHKGWTIHGAGNDKTELFAPRGAETVFINVSESPNSVLKDFRLRGNVGPHGYGDPTWYPGALNLSLSPNCELRDVICIDCWRALSINYSANTWAYNVDAYLTTQLMTYVSWQHAWANSWNGGAVDCGVYSAFLTAGLEAFQSTGTQFIRPVLLNAMASSNSSAGMLVEDMYQRIGAGSGSFLHSLDPNVKYNPSVNFNRNIDNQQGTAEGLSGAGRAHRPRADHPGRTTLRRCAGSRLVPDWHRGRHAERHRRGRLLLRPGHGFSERAVQSHADRLHHLRAAGLHHRRLHVMGPRGGRHNSWAARINNPPGIVRNSKADIINAATKENNGVPGPRPDVGPFPVERLTPPPMYIEPVIEEPPVEPGSLL
jgi:hypothetical protein